MKELLYLKKTWAVLGAIVLLLGIGATVTTIDDRYAHAEEMKAVVQTLQKLNDRIDQQNIFEVQRRIMELETQFRDKEMPKYVADELNFLRLHLQRLNDGR